MAKLSKEDIQEVVREELKSMLDFQEWERKNSEYPEWVTTLWARLSPMNIPLQPNGRYDLRATAFHIVTEYLKIVNEKENNND